MIPSQSFAKVGQNLTSLIKAVRNAFKITNEADPKSGCTKRRESCCQAHEQVTPVNRHVKPARGYGHVYGGKKQSQSN